MYTVLDALQCRESWAPSRALPQRFSRMGLAKGLHAGACGLPIYLSLLNSRADPLIMRHTLLACVCAIAIATPAYAGEEILYADAPDWVEETSIDREGAGAEVAILVLDRHSRIEDGRLWTYQATAVALDTPQAMTRLGTLSAQWLPDKGDLIVHSVELIRDGEVVDLLAEGAEFETLRRERRLERRFLDGALTATMTVPGARLGDVLRFAYSTTLSDQAMGDNVQWQSPILAKPFPLANGRLSVSWPEELSVSRMRVGDADIAEPVLEDGYYTWSAQMPLEERDPTPRDAPARFRAGEVMQVSTYSGWSDVSSHMWQHFDPAAIIAEDGPIAAEIAAIAAKTSDQHERAALAVKLVQDDISYLANGLDGGNYLPQSPEETWEKRFGDCKAKSLLLMAILRELGIEAEVVLVQTRGGDKVASLAPMPGNFNHMIVRAEIDGINLWLDGTTSGTRIDTLDVVPRFHYALPLREEGADLMPLDTRPPSVPGRTVRLTMDQSAGIRLPALFDVEIELRGGRASQLRSVYEQADEDRRKQTVNGLVGSVLGNVRVVERSLEYDEETGIAMVRAKGIQTTPWKRDQDTFELEPPAQAAKSVGFTADRARADWRDIPLRLNGPVYFASELNYLLPEGNGVFELEGAAEQSQQIGGVELSSLAALDGNRLTLSQTMRSIAEELPADQIPVARRELARFDRALPLLSASDGVRELWEYFGEDRARLDPIEARYAQAIADADDDDPQGFLNRARFRYGVYDFAGALEDVEAAYAIEASRPTYLLRAQLQRQTGDLEGALENLRTAEDLQPDGSTFGTQIEMLALLGRPDEALELAEEYGRIADDATTEASLMADALGWSGSYAEGLETLEALAARRPGDGSLLNGICWFAGTWNLVDEARLETCVEAVEKSDYSANALDSRALAHLRMGDLDAAKADVDAALLVDPSLAPSRLLRGIIRVAQGDNGGREEIDLALAMRPSMRATYEAWGLEF